MVAELTRLTHKIAIQLHLVAESCTICGPGSRRPVRKLLDTPSCVCVCVCVCELRSYYSLCLVMTLNYLISTTEKIAHYRYYMNG
jgi:hypothetical protein